MKRFLLGFNTILLALLLSSCTNYRGSECFDPFFSADVFKEEYGFSDQFIKALKSNNIKLVEAYAEERNFSVFENIDQAFLNCKVSGSSFQNIEIHHPSSMENEIAIIVRVTFIGSVIHGIEVAPLASTF